MELKDFIKPSETEYTIYSKSGCPNCIKVKELFDMQNLSFMLIDCDEYLIESKPEFLQFIQELSSREWKTFPIVFNKGQFIGGFIDTREYLEKMLEFTDEF
jgi:glutaredoxin